MKNKTKMHLLYILFCVVVAFGAFGAGKFMKHGHHMLAHVWTFSYGCVAGSLATVACSKIGKDLESEED